MSDMQQKPLCPFKKIIEREQRGHKGVVTIRERFDICAGERCMAYRVPNYGYGEHGVPICKRLEGGRK